MEATGAALGQITFPKAPPGRRKGAVMRFVVRVLVLEFSLSWAMILAGAARVGVQIWPFFADSLAAAFRSRALRVCLGLLIGIPVVVGWPLLFRLVQAQHTYRVWWDFAVLWWVLLGGCSGLVLLVRAVAAKPRGEAGETQCRCGTCTGRAFRVLQP